MPFVYVCQQQSAEEALFVHCSRRQCSPRRVGLNGVYSSKGQPKDRVHSQSRGHPLAKMFFTLMSTVTISKSTDENDSRHAPDDAVPSSPPPFSKLLVNRS